jgi:hypothetical protein
MAETVNTDGSLPGNCTGPLALPAATMQATPFWRTSTSLCATSSEVSLLPRLRLTMSSWRSMH